MDKVQNKLQGWKARLLSQAGRATLISSVLQSLPLFTFLCFRAPNSVCKKLDTIVRSFWWGHDIGTRKLHLVNWNKPCKPKRFGDLGFKSSSLFNQALIAKQFWKIQENPNSLLTRTFKKKYFPTCSLREYQPKSHHSWIWRNITDCQHTFLHQGRWLIRNGNQIPLSHPDWFQCPNQVLRDHGLHNGTVAGLVDNQSRTWNCDLIRKAYQPSDAKEILQIPLPKTQGNNDKLIWKHSASGTYKVSQAYTLIHQSQNPSPQNASILCPSVWSFFWKVKLPMRILMFIWKLLHYCLPTFDNLRKRGIRVAGTCLMCNDLEETAVHLFLRCNCARADMEQILV